MDLRPGVTVDVDSLGTFDGLIALGATRMRGWRVRNVDLRQRGDELRTLDPDGSLLLGCDLADGDRDVLQDGGALVFPDLPDLPFDAFRTQLYTPAELYAGIEEKTYRFTPDARTYAWSCAAGDDSARRMFRALHDHAIDECLDRELSGLDVVGVMGGHAVRRDTDDYRRTATLGHRLARAGKRVATGGGPGAMEAANLGAYLSPYDESAIPDALAALDPQPRHRPSVTSWVREAFAVLRTWPDGAASVGIPTWFYGHEPPNVFATAIAKYFQNSVREDTLLRRCNGGIVFVPGAAGTVQEVFQDACENFYGGAGSPPMVLLGTTYWTETLPVWPLLRALAEQTPGMSDAVHVADRVDEAAEILGG